MYQIILPFFLWQNFIYFPGWLLRTWTSLTSPGDTDESIKVLQWNLPSINSIKLFLVISLSAAWRILHLPCWTSSSKHHSLSLAVWLSWQAWLAQRSPSPWPVCRRCQDSTLPLQGDSPVPVPWHGSGAGVVISLPRSWYGLCFGYVLEAVLITQGCFPYCWPALNRAKSFSVPHPPGKRLGILTKEKTFAFSSFAWDFMIL